MPPQFLEPLTGKMFAFDTRDIRQRTWPIIHKTILPNSLIALPKVVFGESIPPNTFRQNGDVWEVRFRGRKAFTLKTKDIGAMRLAFLLSRPNEKNAVIEILFGIQLPGYEATMTDLGTMENATSIRKLGERYNELSREIDIAKAGHDDALLDRLTKEQHQIMDHFRSAYNLKGRLRTVGDPRERARKTFVNAISRVRKRIAKYDPEFAKYLQDHIHCGSLPYYESKDQIQWETKPVHLE